jgi:hypothetical protein
MNADCKSEFSRRKESLKIWVPVDKPVYTPQTGSLSFQFHNAIVITTTRATVGCVEDTEPQPRTSSSWTLDQARKILLLPLQARVIQSRFTYVGLIDFDTWFIPRWSWTTAKLPPLTFCSVSCLSSLDGCESWMVMTKVQAPLGFQLQVVRREGEKVWI